MTLFETITAIEEILEQSEHLKYAYFGTPSQCAGGRRSYEKYNSRDMITWQDGKDTFTAAIKVQCSCKNIYVIREFTRNGKKTTATALKNSLNRLKAVYDQKTLDNPAVIE